MKRIGEENLHHERGYSRISDYAEDHLCINESRWHQLVRYAKTYDRLEKHLDEDMQMPQNEAQSRPLHPHRDDADLLVEIWQQVIQRYGTDLTKSKVEAIVDEITAGHSGDTDGPDGGDSAGGTEGPDGPGSGDESAGDESEGDGAGDEGSEGKDPGDESSQPGGESGPLEKAKEQYPSLFKELNRGVARGVLRIGETIAEGDPGRDSLEIARANFESLSHRRESESGDKPNLPGCLTGSLDPIKGRDILIAFPTELLTPAMAKKAVPVGVPQTQYAVGVPLDYFDSQPPIEEIQAFYREQNRDFSFNSTNENVDWADYTTNPVTGCLHTCSYCYARYQAEALSRYKQGFQPTFFPGRLLGFSQMSPPEKIGHPREKNVFVGSMSDIFGKWVPEWMIQSILDAAEANDGFDHLFLTKFPQKLSQFDFPDNAWVGTTVDKKHRVAVAERHFQQVDAKVKWLSCEPLLENVAPKFADLSMFDCVVIGAQKGNRDIEEKQPELDWVINLYQKAREAGCKVYFKENLDVFPKELPQG